MLLCAIREINLISLQHKAKKFTLKLIVDGVFLEDSVKISWYLFFVSKIV